MAITWKNINAPSFGAANLLSQSAGNRISEGIQGLQDLAQGQADNIRAEEAELKQNNTEDVLNQIYGLQSMEDYSTAVDSGTFDFETLNNTYGGKVDIGQIREALLAQDNTIQDQENTRFQYETTLKTRKDEPIANQFIQDLYGASTVSQVDSLIGNIDNLGLSESGQTAAVKSASDYKQSLLDKKYQETQREQNQLIFDQSQDDRTYNLEQRFIADYNPERTRTVVGLDGESTEESYYPRQDTQSTITSANAQLANLPKKYSLPDNFDDVIQSGTASDAVSEFISGLDSSDIAVQDVHSELLETLKGDTFTDSQGKEYTYSSLPKWVVAQSLQEVTLENPAWYDLTDWGRGDLSSKQKSDLTDSLKTNLELYGTLSDKKQQMDAEKALLNAQINQAQVNQIKLIQEAREEFRKQSSKTGNL